MFASWAFSGPFSSRSAGAHKFVPISGIYSATSYPYRHPYRHPFKPCACLGCRAAKENPSRRQCFSSASVQGISALTSCFLPSLTCFLNVAAPSPALCPALRPAFTVRRGKRPPCAAMRRYVQYIRRGTSVRLHAYPA
jgi:hypothetical protein